MGNLAREIPTEEEIEALLMTAEITDEEADAFRLIRRNSCSLLLPLPQKGPQTFYLESPADIVIYGGSAGGGKSFGTLLDAAAHVDNPEYSAVIFRRTSPQLTAPGGMISESMKVYPGTGATYRKGPPAQWIFPSGASIQFRHLQYDNTVEDWQGSQIAKICFDELTHFTEAQFFYMLSRNRSGCGVRPTVRATTNPKPGWVKAFLAPWLDRSWPSPAKSGELRWFVRVNGEIRWVEEDFRLEVSAEEAAAGLSDDEIEEMRRPKSVTFIRSSVYDNPALLRVNPSYITNLKSLSAVEQARLLHGDWDAAEGTFFDTFSSVLHHPPALFSPEEGRRPPPWWTFFGGYDWGFSDPSAFVLCGTDETGTVSALESWEVARLTNEAQADRVRATLSRWGVPIEACTIYADASMWNKKTINGVQAEADVEAFYRAGLRFVAAAHGEEANRHRNMMIRAFLNSALFRAFRGYNGRLVDCLMNAEHAKLDTEQVLHNEYSHLVYALGCALTSRPKPTEKPLSTLTPEERQEQANKEFAEADLKKRNERLGLKAIVGPDGETKWVDAPKKKRVLGV